MWWKDKFSQFRVFRNCGRSAKRNTTIKRSMLLSWCIVFFFFHTTWKKKNLIESLRKLCEEQDCMFSENCVVWTATWVMIPINVVSSPLPSSLLYFLFFCNIFDEKILFMPFSNVYVSQCRKHLWKNGNTISSFFCKKNSLFVLSIVETSLLWILLLIFQNKTNLYSPFLNQNVVKINSCV